MNVIFLKLAISKPINQTSSKHVFGTSYAGFIIKFVGHQVESLRILNGNSMNKLLLSKDFNNEMHYIILHNFFMLHELSQEPKLR